jgi:hypothetical protein
MLSDPYSEMENIMDHLKSRRVTNKPEKPNSAAVRKQVASQFKEFLNVSANESYMDLISPLKDHPDLSSPPRLNTINLLEGMNLKQPFELELKESKQKIKLLKQRLTKKNKTIIKLRVNYDSMAHERSLLSRGCHLLSLIRQKYLATERKF